MIIFVCQMKMHLNENYQKVVFKMEYTAIFTIINSFPTYAVVVHMSY